MGLRLNRHRGKCVNTWRVYVPDALIPIGNSGESNSKGAAGVENDAKVEMIDEKEIKTVEDIFKAKIPDLQTGVFLSLLDQDKIEGVTKNTEGWLENFRGLTTVK